MAKSKFNPSFYQNFTTNDKGELTYDDNTWSQINARNAAIQKYDDTIRLKQQIQSETEAVILESQKEIKKKSGMLMQIGGGIQTYSNPRNWARGAVGFGKMVFGQTIETTVTGGKAIGEQNAATNLYTQSKDLADQANKIVKTDRPQAEALLRQSQALIEEANKFAQGEATKKIMGADDKLTGKEIFAKSALTAIEVGSLAPIGSVAKGSFMLAKTVPPAVQGTKTVAVGNAITRALGLGDIYQVTKTGLQQGLKQEVKQTIVGQAAKATLQAPVTAGLIEMADDDGVNNYMGSLLTTGVGAFGLTLGFGYAGRVLGGAANEVIGGVTQQLNKKSAAAVTDLAGAIPTPTKSQLLLPDPNRVYEGGVIIPPDTRILPPDIDPASLSLDEIKRRNLGLGINQNPLGAFDPETTIPMVDLTETVKGNNIDFNPDSVMSINATRKAVDDLALLNGNEVGGKKLKINTDDPKFKEIYNNKIKPLVDRINEVDEVALVEVGTYRSVHQIDKSKASSITSINENKLNTFIDEFKKQYGYPALKSKELNKLKKVMSNPEADIKIYRASPVNELNDGDWVTIDKNYANDIKKQNGGKVYTYTVKAKDLLYPNTLEGFKDLPSLNKWGAFQYNDSNLKQSQPQFNKIPVKVNEVSAQQIVEVQSQLDNLKSTEQEVAIELGQNEMQLEALLDELKTHPGKVLHKYANKKEGKLPEITGKGSKYARQGDSIMTELGFTSDDEAQAAYESWLNMVRQRDSLKANIKDSSTFLKDITKEQQTLQKQLEGTQPPIKSYEQPAVQKVPVEDVEMEVQKIYSELENAGINITPEQVRLTPNIQAVDEKLAKGETLTPEEFDKGMKEYVNSTGKTEVIDGVEEELTGPMKKSALVERLNRENPGLNLTSVEYQSAVKKDLKAVADDLIENNFDEAGRIARSINKNSSLQDIKITEQYNNKLIELGKTDELAQTTYKSSAEATRWGQKNGILEEKKMGTPQYAIKQAQDARINKLKPDIEKQVAKVKQQMSSIAVDQTFLSDILDNITCG